MLVHGQAGENVRFMVLDGTINTIIDAENSILFESDAIIGNGLNPFVLQAYSANAIVDVPSSYRLAQNHPNPFNPTTTIAHDLPETGNVLHFKISKSARKESQSSQRMRKEKTCNKYSE